MTTEGKDRIKKLAAEIEKASCHRHEGLGFRAYDVGFRSLWVHRIQDLG